MRIEYAPRAIRDLEETPHGAATVARPLIPKAYAEAQ
jgi:hypothetical protein